MNFIFQIVGKSHLRSLCVRMLGRFQRLKSTALYIFFVINKICQRLIIGLLTTMIMIFFSDFRYDFRSSNSTEEFSTIVADRTLMALNICGAS